MKTEYFKSEEHLIRHNVEKDIYVISNTTKPYIILREEFENIKPIQIKKMDFDCELNSYFRNLKEEWEFEGDRFRNLECFDNEGFSNEINVLTIPRINDIPFQSFIKIYHHGKVYHTLINYSKRRMNLQLFDIKTNRFAKWTSITNCSPIFNINLKTVI